MTAQIEIPFEEWRPIRDFSAYAVSNYGRVKKIKILCNRDTTPIGKILIGCNRKGYHAVGLRKIGGGNKRVWLSVHRLVLESFLGPAPGGYIAHHKNGNTKDNRIDNLEWVTPSTNIQQAYFSGSLNQRGERNNGAKLTEKEVIQIKELLDSGSFKQREIAKIFGVARNTIAQIKNNINWSYLEACNGTR